MHISLNQNVVPSILTILFNSWLGLCKGLVIMGNPNQVLETETNARSVKRDKFTRRGFLGIGSAALAVAGIVPAMAVDRSRSDPGPGNSVLDAQNPDAMWPPGTESKCLIPTFKYPFSLANKRVCEVGW
jgi:hypothetical protein